MTAAENLARWREVEQGLTSLEPRPWIVDHSLRDWTPFVANADGFAMAYVRDPAPCEHPARLESDPWYRSADEWTKAAITARVDEIRGAES